MGANEDARLIGKALRFLATGFDQAANGGLTGTMTVIKDGQSSSPREVRAFCNVEMAELGPISVSLPHDFLADAIIRGTGQCRLKGAEVRGGMSTGGPPQDGAQTYAIQSVEWTYEAVGSDAFNLRGDIVIGEANRQTFVYREPVDLSDRIHRVEVRVPFVKIFNFVYVTTRPHADALCENILRVSGKRVAAPKFVVTEKSKAAKD